MSGSIKKEMQNQIYQAQAVLSKLYELVAKGVISVDELSMDYIVDEGEKIPRIGVTVDRLYSQGYFAGLEDAVKSFCYNIGAGIGVEEIINKIKKDNDKSND